MNVHSESEDTQDPKRRKILQAALILFSDYGFHGTAMAKLAKSAGVPVGTLYRHFASKEELIHALYIDMKRERFAAMLEGHDPALPLRARFDLYWKNTYEYCVTHPREFKFTEQYSFSPYLRDVTQAIQHDMSSELGKFFSDGYRGGVFKTLPPQILFAMINGPLNALVTREIAGVIKLKSRDLQDVMDACWVAITV